MDLQCSTLGLCCTIVRTLNSLILNATLDENRHYSANSELVRWETNMEKIIEQKTFQDGGKSDYDRYAAEEIRYNGKMP